MGGVVFICLSVSLLYFYLYLCLYFWPQVGCRSIYLPECFTFVLTVDSSLRRYCPFAILAFLPSCLLSSKSTSISPVINIFALLVIKAAQYFTSLSNFSLDAVIVVMEKYEAGLDLVWLKWLQEEGYATLKEGTMYAGMYTTML